MVLFAIVEFVATLTIAIIPTKWFASKEEDVCFWPPAGANIKHLVLKEVTPTESWSKFSIRCLGKASMLSFVYLFIYFFLLHTYKLIKVSFVFILKLKYKFRLKSVHNNKNIFSFSKL